MATAKKTVKKVARPKNKIAPPKKTAGKKSVSNPTKKATKKSPVKVKKNVKAPSKNKVVDLKSVIKKAPPKVKKKVVKPKTDTILSCHRCGEVTKVNFEHAWTNGWPMHCREGMHIEHSDIKIGEVMNKAWNESGGFAGNFTVR